MRLLAITFLLAASFSLQGCQTHPVAAAEPLPANRLDPQDPRAQNASGGASAPQAAPETGDVGKEADKEDELYRKLHKP